MSEEGLAHVVDSSDLQMRHKSHGTKLSKVVEGLS